MKNFIFAAVAAVVAAILTVTAFTIGQQSVVEKTLLESTESNKRASAEVDTRISKVETSVGDIADAVKTVNDQLRGIEGTLEGLKQPPVVETLPQPSQIGRKIEGQAILVRNNGEAIPVVNSKVLLLNQKDGDVMIEMFKKVEPLLKESAIQQRLNTDRLTKMENISAVRQVCAAIMSKGTPIQNTKTNMQGEFSFSNIEDKKVWIVVSYSTEIACGMWIEEVEINQDQTTQITLDSENIRFISQK